MKNRMGIIVAAIIALVIALFAVYMIDIDQTREAKLPDVDVNVKGGQTPEFDAKTGDVDVTEKKAKVAVPKVEIEEEEITVPSVEITPPEESNQQ